MKNLSLNQDRRGESLQTKLPLSLKSYFHFLSTVEWLHPLQRISGKLKTLNYNNEIFQKLKSYFSVPPGFSGLTVRNISNVRSFHPHPIVSGIWLKVLSSVHSSTQGPYHNVRTNVMNECAGSWKEKHLSGLATLTLHDFHLAWPIHAFPPTQQPAAGGESQTSRAASWRNTTAGAKGADSPEASVKTKPLSYDGEIWFQWCGLRRTSRSLLYCGWTVAQRKEMEKPGTLCHSSRLPISINGCLGVLFFTDADTCQSVKLPSSYPRSAFVD